VPRKKRLKVEYREAEIMCSTCDAKLGQFGVEANARLEAMICLCTNCGRVTMARDTVDLLFDSQLFAPQGPKVKEPAKHA
jgi:Zn finger protein HypA/HybF involved in hydrogenase expression